MAQAVLVALNRFYLFNKSTLVLMGITYCVLMNVLDQCLRARGGAVEGVRGGVFVTRLKGSRWVGAAVEEVVKTKD